MNLIEYACRSFESRNLDCNIDPDLSMEERAGTYYNCSMLPLFDLGSLHHDFYLLNIRLGQPLPLTVFTGNFRFPSAYMTVDKETISINTELGRY